MFDSNPIFNPSVFQGKTTQKDYFEGWYFKNVSSDCDSVLSFIPGISTSGKPHAFIQMFDGRSGQTEYFEFDLADFSATKDKFEVRIHNNIFSDKGFTLDIDRQGRKVKAKVQFSDITPYPVSLISPGIMGWYRYMPFMECYHGVVSVNHFLKGSVIIDGKISNFDNGKGYIEKDWGISFPECWIWLQGNCFEKEDACVMLSVAKIPFLGTSFVGFICFANVDGKLYRFMTYTGAKMTHIESKNDLLYVTVADSKYEIRITAKQTDGKLLVAPVKGSMERNIKESLDSEVEFELRHKNGDLIYKGSSLRAGLEVTGDIINLAKQSIK